MTNEGQGTGFCPLALAIIGREVRPPDYVYAQRVECEEPCEGRLSRTVL